MEFKFRATDEKPPTYIPRLPPPYPPPTSISYFTEQAIRVGYSGPNFAGHTTEYFRNPNGVREAIQREIEKERIRDEIIAAEIARKRMLEAEVRREMMVEREWALRRGGGAGGGGFPTMMFEQPRLSIEDRIALSLEETLGGGVHHARRGGGIAGFETAPFQRSAEPKITEVTATQLEVSKEKVIFVAKPDGNLSGSKRKAVTPLAAGATETTPVGSKKKTKEEWSCAICQVSATSERGLNEHLQGKKHKSKEAGLRAQKTGKNYAIGLFPKKNAKPIKIVEPTSNQNSEQGEKANTEDVKQNNDLALVVFKDTGDSKNENGNSPQKMHQKNGELVKDKNRFKFWCEMCQIGAFSEKVMNKHRKGKKHMGRLLSSVLGGQVVEDPQKESAAADLVEKDGKEEKLENVAADGDAVENHKAADQNGDVQEKGCDVQKMMERMEPLNV